MLVAIAALSWAYIAWLASSPMAMMAPDIGRWTPGQFVSTALMWAVMMVGMMTPSVAPMVLLYARVARHSAERGTPFAASGWFAAGYFLAWTGFAIAATAAQWGLERALLLSPMTASAGPRLGAALLIAAGLYQFSPLKSACLSQCQAPMAFIQRHGGFRPGRRASLELGLRHGAYCLGCCWALMALLFVGGVMNLLWIAALGALVLTEKLVPGRAVQRLAGAAMLGGGALLLLG